MASYNIRERRAYIKSLLDNREEIDIKSIVKMWDSSYASVIVDIAICRGERDPYYEKVPQWTSQNQRAARLGASGKITEQDWLSTLQEYGNVCINCGTGDDIVIDHIIPLSRGGTNTKENIQPLCRACNTSKRNKMPDEWAARRNGRKGGRPRKAQ